MAELPVILIHHLTSPADVQRLLADAPAGAYRLTVDKVTLEKINAGPEIKPAFGCRFEPGFVLTTVAPMDVYDAPNGKVVRQLPVSYRMDVFEYRLDGWMRVTKTPPLLWIRGPRQEV